MQPESHQSVSTGAEQLPVQPTIGPENIPSLPPIEVQVGRGQEAYEQRADTAGGAQNSGAPQYQTQQPVAPQVPQAVPVTQPTVGSPMVAADEDLIEKEWVDKAKEIIQRTGDDPYARSAQVSELQRSYLQKRYGKTVGVDTE
ncbi:hypothetical protein KI440_03580 [Candidatus Saccharibacteria bacterium TM7i]|nr:hypothetical protein KI440_03580 [Candidatus Saccharibacteria bacterium TM7i]